MCLKWTRNLFTGIYVTPIINLKARKEQKGKKRRSTTPRAIDQKKSLRNIGEQARRSSTPDDHSDRLKINHRSMV